MWICRQNRHGILHHQRTYIYNHWESRSKHISCALSHVIPNLIRDNWRRFQGELFPEIQDAVGPLLKNHQRFVMALGIICPEDFTLRTSQRNGRPLCDRINLVRAFIAKAIWDIPTTRDLVERLKVERQMRNLCGWVLIHEIPSESTFSRAFAEFAESNLPGRMHEPRFSSWSLIPASFGRCFHAISIR